MRIVDLRSDTITHPTAEMRRAMAQAEVGDDVYGEDPTVNRLQALAARMLGKEAGLFVASGTMGNLAAMLAHCNRGDEAILGSRAHTVLFEAGGLSALGGVHSRQVPNLPDGTLPLEEIEAAIRPDDAHHPITRLITLENTQNHCGGAVLSVEYTQAVAELAHRRGLVLHIDGARLFNAAVALGVPASALTAPADSVSICLSKGLCAPVGSVLCGSSEFIHKAHRIRKMLGGGMRQAGVLAAAGIIALETMVERLADDHRRARHLAEALSRLPGLRVDPPPTNMVFLTLDPSLPFGVGDLLRNLGARDVKAGAAGPRRIRMVLHNDIDDASVEQAIQAFNAVLQPDRML